MRKQSANWYIAATHYLTAGFAIPLLIMFIFGLFIGFLPALPPILIYLLYPAVRAVTILVATIYSANFLKKKYIIKDRNKIVNLSTIYLVVIEIIIMLLRQSFSALSVIVLAVETVVFYLASKKYIEETSEETAV